MERDESGSLYEEIEIEEGRVRVTFIPTGWANMPSVRIQMRDETGHLRQGPEIPINNVGAVVGAIVNLLSASR